MDKRRSIAVIVMLAVAAAVLTIAAPVGASAGHAAAKGAGTTTQVTQPTADGVLPTVVPGNPADCGAGTARHPGLGITGATTLKYDSSQSGTLSDGTLTVTVTTADGITFGFSASLPGNLVIQAVYAKGGNQGGNLYDYRGLTGGGVLSDSGLHPPLTGNNGNGGFAGLSHILFCYGPGTGPPPVTANISAGYAYTFSTAHAAVPTPWQGDPSVIFVGCGFGGSDVCPKDGSGKDLYDAGALRVDNTSAVAIAVTGASVQIGSCVYQPWPGLNVSVAPGKSLILTQTGGLSPCGNVLGNYNFDTSESNLAANGMNPAVCTTNDGLKASISITINGTARSFTDNNQILNDHGLDPGDPACGQGEDQAWSQLT